MQHVLIGALVIGLCSAAARADGLAAYDAVPAGDHAWYAKAYEHELLLSKGRVMSAEKEVRRHRTGKKRQAAEMKAASAKDRYAALEKNDPPFVPLLGDGELRAGRYGRLRTDESRAAVGLTRLKVEQVIDDGEVIVTPTFQFVQRAERVRGQELQQLDTRQGKPWILSGIDTTNTTDGDRLRLDGSDVFFVTGTETYETIDGGTNTVFRLERVDPEDVFKRKADADDSDEDE